MLVCERLNLLTMESLGQKVRRLREERFMSQEELAGKAGVSRTTIQNVEADKRTGQRGRTVRSLAIALGVDVMEFGEAADGEVATATSERVPVAYQERILRAASDAGVSVEALIDAWLSAYPAGVPTADQASAGAAARPGSIRSPGQPMVDPAEAVTYGGPEKPKRVKT
jgi:transcriptional regulator with XRE-family HTH domain